MPTLAMAAVFRAIVDELAEDFSPEPDDPAWSPLLLDSFQCVSEQVDLFGKLLLSFTRLLNVFGELFF